MQQGMTLCDCGCRLRDNISLEASERMKMYSDEQGNCKLVITDVEAGDAGLYYCVAENAVGKSKSTATLRVTGEKHW